MPHDVTRRLTQPEIHDPTSPGSLLTGYRSFKNDRYMREHARYRALAEQGQRPEVMVIACCDSRSAPETNIQCLARRDVRRPQCRQPRASL